MPQHHDATDKAPAKEQRDLDREAEEANQQHVRDEVYKATHNKDGSPKPLPAVILP